MAARCVSRHRRRRRLAGKASVLSLIGLISWRYRNPVSLLCERLGIQPATAVNASMGGETPIRLLHEPPSPSPAAKSPRPPSSAAKHSPPAKPARPGLDKDAPAREAVRFPSSSFTMSPVARPSVSTSAQIYPFYEMATQAAWAHPAEADKHSAILARFASVAATQPHAWIQTARTQIPSPRHADNRLINCLPQADGGQPQCEPGGAVIVASSRRRGRRRAEDKIIQSGAAPRRASRGLSASTLRSFRRANGGAGYSGADRRRRPSIAGAVQLLPGGA